MTTFRDNMDQDWNISLTLSKVRKLRETLGLDLLNPEHFMRVLGSLTDRLTFVFLLCESQAKEYEIDADEFEERLYGDGFSTAASMAFLEECENFFRKLGQTAMAKLAEKQQEVMKMGEAKMMDVLKSGRFDSMLSQAADDLEKLLPANDGNG